jgi:hypothetical protein
VQCSVVHCRITQCSAVLSNAEAVPYKGVVSNHQIQSTNLQMFSRHISIGCPREFQSLGNSSFTEYIFFPQQAPLMITYTVATTSHINERANYRRGDIVCYFHKVV